MKFTRTLQIVSMLILGIGQASGSLQIYDYSGPVSGYTEVDLTPYGVGNGGFSTTFGTLTETLYYDPVAQTLEEVGSVTVNPSTGSFNIAGSFIDPGDIGSATLTLGIGGSFSFDHTTFGVTPGGGGVSLGQDSELHVPVSGSGIYNGQAFSGSWNIDLLVAAEISSVSPTSLTFSEGGAPNFSGVNATQGSYVIPGTNLKDAISDGTYYWSWETGGVATAVPELRNYSLYSAVGLLVLAFFSSIRRRTA
jgi:hypothetical protein